MHVVRGVVESIKIITSQASSWVVEYAFHYAKTHGRQRVSVIHKANIMRKTDGQFLKCCREVAERYPEITYEEVMIDNCCMMLVKNPTLFDALLMPNLHALLLSSVATLRHLKLNDKADRIHDAILNTIDEINDRKIKGMECFVSDMSKGQPGFARFVYSEQLKMMNMKM
ncbi:hypothetical protein J5N97_022365 [Dioscorea zingiberensis]|uniref:Isopropylmalate dehydrogenase-like domain-containing protein n=1 Tax=Dioscorea zingiberensis TaxID=325984 RepID=A0A9D5CB26_9LILI|nr:hypothetical protein J5N97_022365 [Dioscorea zingiberensis]